MASLKLHAGDFGTGKAQLMFGVMTCPWKPGDGWAGEAVALSELAEVEIASEAAAKRLGGTVGWGMVGATVLGPVGLLAGLLAGGRKTEVTFVAKFKDGRKLLASADSGVYRQFQSATFK